jgi:repressor LexA
MSALYSSKILRRIKVPKKQNINLTPKQLLVLREIQNFENNTYCSATIAELAKKLNLSRSTVFEHIAELRNKGLLTTAKGRARCSRLTARASRLLEKQKAPENKKIEYGNSKLPLAGTVAAGTPIEAIQDNSNISFDNLFGTYSDLFALKVAGDSMTEEGILDGDYIICRKTSSAANGDLVVAIVEENTATLKRFYKEPSRVRLEPANPNYKPIYTKNCRIEAIATGLVRNSV